MLAALRARQEALEETLRQRLEELKSICIREAVRENSDIVCEYYFNVFLLFFSNFIPLPPYIFQELTGKLPKEYPLDPGEEPPTVRRKIGTAFKLDEQKILPKGEVKTELLVLHSNTLSHPTISQNKLKLNQEVIQRCTRLNHIPYCHIYLKLALGCNNWNVLKAVLISSGWSSPFKPAIN